MPPSGSGFGFGTEHTCCAVVWNEVANGYVNLFPNYLSVFVLIVFKRCLMILVASGSLQDDSAAGKIVQNIEKMLEFDRKFSVIFAFGGDDVILVVSQICPY